jgi:hypothetical protein
MPFHRPTFDYAPYNEFIRITLRKFRVLERRCGLEVHEILALDPRENPVAVRYMNETTGVEVGYGMPGSLPNVSLHPLKPGARTWNLNGYGLSYFIRERCPDQESDESDRSRWDAALTKFSSTSNIRPVSRILNKIIGRYASALEQHASDFLTGDFSFATQIDKLVRREMAREYRKRKSQ